MRRLVPVVLAGGSGTRLWPLSTPARPKQFLPLIRDASPFSSVLAAVSNLGEPPLICGSQSHRALLDSELADSAVTRATVFLEENPHGTAASLACALLELQARAQVDLRSCAVFVASSDIELDWNGFEQGELAQGIKAALGGAEVLFAALPPREPTPAFASASCGYGHLIVEDSASDVRRVREIIEKPGREQARELRTSGAWWSSGLYILRADRALQVLAARHAPLLEACAASMRSARREEAGGQDWVTPGDKYLHDTPALSLDAAFIRPSQDVVAVLLKRRWGDLGTWPALHALSPQDENEQRHRRRR
jgi:mannose-1-phosphate guanylyltransferase